MLANRPPFDAVLFDLDGTLVATERFWPQAAREGARRALRELGLERELPSAARWMSLVGHPLEEGFRALFPDLDPSARQRVLEACVEEEHRALVAGGAAFLPGAQAALETLAARGVALGVASNCSRGYLDRITVGLGLDRWIQEARCLSSPGVHDKADMVADLLATFGTRSAVMVGDRASDRDAAWANGIPHVHLSRGYAEADEWVECEARLDGLDELVERLDERTRWIDSVLARLDLPAGAAALGVSGGLASGKSLFARDLAHALERTGRPAAVVALDDFASVDPAAGSAVSGIDADALARSYDVAALLASLLRPHRRREHVDLVRRAPQALLAGRIREARVHVPAGALLVLEGPGLLHPSLSVHLDRLVWLEVNETTALRRLAGRDARLFGPRALEAAHAVGFSGQRALCSRYPPAERATLVLAADNPLGPPAGRARPRRQ